MDRRHLVALLVAVAHCGLGKWDVINRAMDDTGRTIRLIVILVAMALVTAAPAVAVYVLARR